MTLRNRFHLFGLFSLLLLLMSCSNDDGPTQQPIIGDDHPVSKVLRKYIAASGFTRNSSQDLVITNIEQQTYHLTEDGTVERNATRTTENSFEVIRADFKKDNVNGYAYLTTHPKAEGVYYYTDYGNISDTLSNKALGIMLSAIPTAIGDSISSGNKPVTPGGGIGDLELSTLGSGPLLKTKWGQKAPYNKFLPLCYCDNPDYHNTPHHCLVGCTNVAVGQVIAYCKRFTGTYHGNGNINFAELVNISRFSNESYKIASFLREITIQVGSQLGCRGTGAHVNRAAKYLSDMGYTVEYEEGNFDMTKVNSCLYGTSKKCPVIISGFTKNKEGHTWVIDGVQFISGANNQYSLNWGWAGTSDGWVDSSVLCLAVTEDNTQKNFYIANCAIYITDY